jgi:NADH-quinone oxidoreductase subunit H
MADFNLWITLITIVAVIAGIIGICTFLILAERKISAWMQDRIGPNRVGPHGILQPIADMLKFLFKEEIVPAHVQKLLYILAPALAVSTALLAFAVVPFGPTHGPAEAGLPSEHPYQFVIAPGVDIGIVFVFAVSSLNVYGILLGGWSSNNKYSLFGALRSSAQIVSYEIPMGLSILGVILFSGSLNLETVIGHQVAQGGLLGGWNIWFQPLGFLLFLTSVFAECNRLPFDLPEAEQELVGGYHTEYSALKFAFFFLGEYTHMITTSFLLVILFFGGWDFPGISSLTGLVGVVLKFLVFFLKMASFILFYMMIRWTLPRFRFDQLMGLAWKAMIPLALANLLCVMVVLQLGGADGPWRWILLPVSLLLLLGAAALAGYWPQEPRSAVTSAGSHRFQTARDGAA